VARAFLAAAAGSALAGYGLAAGEQGRVGGGGNSCGWPAAVTEYLKGAGYGVKTGPAATPSAIERHPATGTPTSAAR
jgi:hypothetical protein